MAALPYMQFYVGDYLADTGHLTTVQHGAYLLLMLNYWRRGEALADDDARLSATVKMTKRVWLRNRPVLAEFFEVSDGVWRHKRIEKDLKKSGERSSKARESRMQALNERHNEGPTNVERTLNERSTISDIRSQSSDSEHSAPESESESEEPPNPLAGAFESVWPQYVNTVGRKAAERHFKASVKTERDLRDIQQALANYKRHLELNPDKPQMNGSTWFNNWRDWVKWLPWMEERQKGGRNAESAGQRTARNLGIDPPIPHGG